MNRLRRAVAWTLASSAWVACSDGTSPEAIPCTDDTGTVDVTVTSGSSPTIGWEPDCAMAMLLIEENASDRWGLIAADDAWDDGTANRIRPPVTYGVIPSVPGVEALEPEAAPLLPGVVYEVVLWRVLPEGSAAVCLMRLENACLMALHEFTR